MTTYIALLRGIMPANPNTRNTKLKMLFESLGFHDVLPIISSGNVLFKTQSKNIPTLEKNIEKALSDTLQFTSCVIIRSSDDIKNLIKRDPFKGIKDERPNYLVVTFFKYRKKELCSVLNSTDTKTTDFMRVLEKKYGKEITTRTWKTVHRIMSKME